jgi:hypothetical protein
LQLDAFVDEVRVTHSRQNSKEEPDFLHCSPPIRPRIGTIPCALPKRTNPCLFQPSGVERMWAFSTAVLRASNEGVTALSTGK